MNIMNGLLRGAVIAIAALCTTAVFAQAVTPAPAAPKEGKPIVLGDAVRSADRSTPTPNYQRLAAGLFGRQIVQTMSSGGDYSVQIWSLLVGPRVTTGAANLRGAAVLTVHSGSVDLIVGEKKTHLEAGDTAAVPEGAALRLINADQSRPAQLRAVVLSGGG
jgi:mannose-6-phosphate isomerase-like protein (cupin superfamily)